MKTRIALIGVIVEDTTATEEINALLHEYGDWIVGRMGIPYRRRQLSIISVVVDAPVETVSALSGKLGRINGVRVSSVFSKEK